MKHIIILSITILSFSACREDKKIPYCKLHPDQCRDVTEPKDFFSFKEGSYWVYEEENSGMVDSVYTLYSNAGPYCYSFDIRLHSTYDTYDYRFWSVLAKGCPECGLIKKDDHCVIVKKAKIKPGDFVTESYCFFTYAGVGDFIYSYGGPYVSVNALRVASIHDSLEIQGFKFYDVVCMHEDHTASEESQPTNHYYSKGIGLVKKELLDSNQTWNLIKYHIEN